MQGLHLKIYPPKNTVLKELIKYYWVFKSDQGVNIDGKLFPVNNIDLIINLSTPIKYIMGTDIESFSGVHFSGIQSKYRNIQQSGTLDVIGISFFPTGVYPFIKIPLSEFANKIVSIDNILPDFEKELENIRDVESDYERISMIEKILMNLVNTRIIPENKLNMIVSDFFIKCNIIKVNSYCNQIGISQKTLERYFNKYIGTSPKTFLRISKFQRLLKLILNRDFQSLTHLTFDYNYFDQTHFINDFKSFIGTTPFKLSKDKNTIMGLLTE